MDLVDGFVNLAIAALNFIGTQELVKYANQLSSIQTQLNDEIAKGFDSDDGKIESLYQQRDVAREAIQNEIALLSAGKNQTPVAAAPAPAAAPAV